jgi:hypothetical protein
MEKNSISNDQASDAIVSELFRISSRVGLLNQYMRKVQNVSISRMDPIYSDKRQLEGFHIRAEGPSKQMRYLQRLLKDANLKVS